MMANLRETGSGVVQKQTTSQTNGEWAAGTFPREHRWGPVGRLSALAYSRSCGCGGQATRLRSVGGVGQYLTKRKSLRLSAIKPRGYLVHQESKIAMVTTLKSRAQRRSALLRASQVRCFGKKPNHMHHHNGKRAASSTETWSRIRAMCVYMIKGPYGNWNNNAVRGLNSRLFLSATSVANRHLQYSL